MWFPQTPKYDGPDQPGPCQTQGDSILRWVVAIVGALVPSTPTYDTKPQEPVDGDEPSIGPAPSGAKANHEDQMQPLVHLFRALFGQSK